MGEKLKVNINDLEVWSENPRHIEDTENSQLSEVDIINILVGVVGYRFMYNLAADILDKGLMGNTSPVVVHSNNKYFVYDGNRRISSIKILLNSSILDASNIQLKKLIDKLLSEDSVTSESLDCLKEIEVYCTTKEDALDIMDKTHSGIHDGVGTIPWDAYQRDKANAKRSIIDYPNAFGVVTKLKMKKNDIKDEYTSYERIFGNAKFKELFKIENYNVVDYKYLKSIYNLLCKYKTEVHHNKGLSRIFNKANEASEEFFKWATPRLMPDKYITISFFNKEISLFKGQKIDENMLNFSVLDYDGNVLKLNDELILKSFRSPTNVSTNQIDTNEIGEWHYVVSYKDIVANLIINIRNLLDPVISLITKEKKLYKGESIVNLRKYILFASDSFNNNVVDEVNITSENSDLSKYSFLNTNKIGKHKIIYSYLDPHSLKQVTECLIVEVCNYSKSLTTEVESRDLLSFEYDKNISKYILKLSWSVRKLIKEINSLFLKEHLYVIASALRSLFSLLYSYYCRDKGRELKDNLGSQISDLCNALVMDFKNNHEIISKENWVNEKMLVDTFRSLNQNKQWFVDVLNCGAHTAGENLAEEEIRSAAKKLSQFIMYISILLYKEDYE